MEGFLLGLMRANEVDPLVEKAVLRICGGSHGMRVALMARELAATERTLERRFVRAIGVAPKMFARVMRLQAALAGQGDGVRWSELAVDGGFYDQAHLHRETRELFGTSPSTMVAPSANSVAQGFRNLSRKASVSTTIFR